MRAFRKAGFTLAQTKKLGFKVSWKLWSTCLNENERKKGLF
jgi:hypothetical protein